MMRFLMVILITLTLFSCKPETYTPKPRGYARVDLPEHAYQSFSAPGFPYSFEYPTYGRIVKDTLFFGHQPENPYWINIDFSALGASLYVSYKQISPAQPLDSLIEDAHEMSYAAHSKKADYISPKVFGNPQNKVYCVLYDVGGNAASAVQFIATDSTKHFMRGALYFDVSPNADSLKPINEFLRADIVHMIETMKWNEEVSSSK
jgi:gliding motility-associated lipoprotein GldD